MLIYVLLGLILSFSPILNLFKSVFLIVSETNDEKKSEGKKFLLEFFFVK